MNAHLALALLPLLFNSVYADEYVAGVLVDTSDAVIIKSEAKEAFTGICSGVLVSPTLVLTAAHCVKDNSDFRVAFSDSYYKRAWTMGTQGKYDSYYSQPLSNSRYDIGMIELARSLSPGQNYEFKKICQKLHLKETVLRVGFGGRGTTVLTNDKKEFTLPVIGSTSARLSLKLKDPVSAAGDSGGPVYAVEDGVACILAVHSTIVLTDTGLDDYSLNTVVKETVGRHDPLSPAIAPTPMPTTAPPQL